MSLLDKYNKGINRFEFEAGSDVEYRKLEDLFNEKDKKKNTIKVMALFINNKSKFGRSPVAVTEKFNVNLPNHLTETVEEMIKDDEVVELANNNGLGMEIYSYSTKKWGICYSVNFVELF